METEVDFEGCRVEDSGLFVVVICGQSYLRLDLRVYQGLASIWAPGATTPAEHKC